MAGQMLLLGGSAPGTPAANYVSIYYDTSDKRVKAIDSDGKTHVISEHAVPGNVLVNGGFDFAQRQVPGTLTTYDSATGRNFGADRWGMTNENASVQYARADTSAAPETGLTSRFYGRFVKITNAGKIAISQVIEGHNVMPLRGRNVRLSVKLKRATGTAIKMRLGLLYLTSAGTIDTIPATFATMSTADGTDPTWGTNLTAIAPTLPETGGIIGNGMDCTITNAWQRFSCQFAIPSNCLNLVAVLWSDANLAVNDEVDASEFQLTDGGEIMDWVPRPYGQELALCQRYYAKTFNVDQNPTTNVGTATGEMRWGETTALSTAQPAAMTWEFPVPMRAAPTLTAFNPGAANAQARNITDGADCSATTVTANGEKRCFVAWTNSAAGAVGEIVGLHISASAEL